MTKIIKVVNTCVSNVQCDLGCYNEGVGAYIEIDGVKVFDEPAWATCNDGSEIDQSKIFQELFNILGVDAKITVEYKDSDNGDYDFIFEEGDIDGF